MNNRSFMRVADENKIEEVKKACVELVVSKGYGGASVSEIARRAAVSKGYLYRFYKNKEELVQSLLTQHIDLIIDHINDLLSQNISLKEVITFLVHYIFTLGEENPESIKFVYVLMHDYNFQFEKKQQIRIEKTIKRIHEIGKQQNFINKLCKEEEIFTTTVIYPIDFMNLRFKHTFGYSGWHQDDIKRVTAFCIHTLSL